MNADGSGQRRVTTDAAGDFWPEWTADGRIVFQRGPFDCPPCEGWIANADGSATVARARAWQRVDTRARAEREEDRVREQPRRRDLAALRREARRRVGEASHRSRAGAFGDFQPRWSPHGNDLVFGRDVNGVDNDVYTVHADGSELQRVTSTPARIEAHADWSAKGDRLIFGVFPGGGAARLHTMALDGSDEQELPLQRGRSSTVLGRHPGREHLAPGLRPGDDDRGAGREAGDHDRRHSGARWAVQPGRGALRHAMHRA